MSITEAGYGKHASDVGVSVVGNFRVTIRGGPVRLAPCQQRLTAMVAIADRPVARSALMRVLWPDASEQHAAARLRTALWAIRRQCSERLLTTESDQVDLAEGVVCDYRSARQLAYAPIVETCAPAACQTAFLRQHMGEDLLINWDDEWLQVEREAFHELRLDTLDAASRRHRTQGRHREAIELALLALAGDPLRESAHACLIEAHIEAGNRTAAIMQYERYKQLLDLEYGLSPAPSIRSVVLSLTAGH